jgi:hypothetical protein
VYTFQIIGKEWSRLVLKKYFKKYFKEIAWSFFFNVISHRVHLKSCAWPNVSAWLFVYVVIHFFHCVTHLVGLPPSLKPLVCHIALMLNLWTSRESTFFGAPWWGKDEFPWYYVRCLCIKDARFHVYMNRPTFFHCLPFSFHIDGLTLCFDGWCSDVGWHCQYWPHLSIFDSWATLSCGVVAIVTA